MGVVQPIPRLGAVLRDVRGAGRALRVSWHGEDGLVVLSLWDGPRCTGTVRLAAADVPVLVEALQLGLVDALPPPGPLGEGGEPAAGGTDVPAGATAAGGTGVLDVGIDVLDGPGGPGTDVPDGPGGPGRVGG